MNFCCAGLDFVFISCTLREVGTKHKGTKSDEKRDAATVVVVSRVTPTTHAQFKTYAAAQRRSLSKQIRVLIEDAITAHEEEEAA